MSAYKKTAILFLAVIFSLSIFGGYLTDTLAAESVRVGYADIAVIFDSYNKTKEQDTVLTAKGDKKKQEHDSMVEKIKNMKNELDLLKEEQKQKKQEQIDQELKKLQDFDRDTKEALREERDNMVRDILKEIDNTIKEYAKKNDYTIILNSRVLVYAQEQNDITKDIINLLNSKYPKKK